MNISFENYIFFPLALILLALMLAVLLLPKIPAASFIIVASISVSVFLMKNDLTINSKTTATSAICLVVGTIIVSVCIDQIYTEIRKGGEKS